MIEKAEIITDGDSQVVLLPETCRIDGDEVLVEKVGSAILLIPKNSDWTGTKIQKPDAPLDECR